MLQAGMATTRIMLCADDYALTPGVSRGILDLIEVGRITATSAMTNRPSWPQAARDLAGAEAGADIGLHLNLTQGAPLAAMPHLAPAGELPPLGQLVKGALTGRLDLEEIRAEVRRQLDAFEQAMGRPPVFVDGHQHVQVLPGIRRVLTEELAARGLGGRVFLRDSSDRLGRILARRVEAQKAVIVAALATGFSAGARRHGFTLNEGFSGYSAFDPARDYGADFARFLIAPGSRHLVMCHPGRVDADLAASDPVVATREAERQFLLSRRFDDLLASGDLQLSRWNS
jgi:predicted glycoside hydrolase/deacetylase ChbG (UPF0249 family)